MRNVKLLIPAFTLAAVSSLSLAAQQPANSPPSDMPQPGTASPQQTTPAPQSASPAEPAPSTANSPEVNNADLRPVTGELVSKLDTKNAKSGDEVVVKTTQKTTIANGVVIPKGSKITGHITDVTAHDATNPNSKVAIQFDQAQLKDGQTMPIKSVLQSVDPASGSDAAQGASPFGSGAAPSAPTSAPSTGGGAGNAGAGSASGGGGSYGSSPSMQTQQGSATASPSAGASVGGPASGTVVAHQGNIDIKTTGIPGVLIAANSNGQPFSNASGALLGAKQNVHLDGGTKVTLAIADANNHASMNR
jgi:hypothetical protein